MLGQAERAWISRSGIELDNQIFHDQRITTELLERLKQHAEKSGGFEKGLFKRRKIGVLVTTDRVDASYIMVWDPSSKRGVRLPNARAEFTKGTSWRLIKRLRAFAAAENLAFRSEDDMIYARAELSRRLKEVGFFPTFREARPWAPDIDQSPALNPGDTVKIIEVGQEEDIPSSSAAAFREDSRRPAIQADRGKNKGSARSRKKSKKPASGRTKPLDRQASKPLDSPTRNPLVSRDPPGRWDADPGMSNKDAAETMRRLKSERKQ